MPHLPEQLEKGMDPHPFPPHTVQAPREREDKGLLMFLFSHTCAAELAFPEVSPFFKSSPTS